MNDNFTGLTAEIVSDWAIGTVGEWLEGYVGPQTDERLDRCVPIQYRARPDDDGTWIFEPWTHGADDWRQLPTQRFRISISVTEIES